MAKNRIYVARALGSTALAGACIALSAPAAAQTTQEEQSAQSVSPASDQAQVDASTPADQKADGEIVVTGSRIRRPNLDSPVPVTSLSGETFFQTGTTSIGDVLNQLPALRSTFSQSNSTRFLGTAGLSLLDLRGLGTQRTLVLVNGRRHVGGDILSDGTSVDINTIPTDLIDRVDVVTGGDSAVYGSDALAGVVNFVLKDHYQGVQVRGQAGISEHGDAGNQFISVLAGQNFADGRGNIALNVEYAHQEDFYSSQRKAYRTVNGFYQIHAVGTADAPQSDFFHDVRSGVYTNGGTFLDYFGGSTYTPLLFQPDGTLIEQTGTQIDQSEITSAPSYLGGNGDNFRDGLQTAFRPKLDRYSANLIAHFDISTALVPFVEATYSRTDSFGGSNGPFFTNALGERFHTDNPYLSNQARGIIRDYYGDYDGDGLNNADQYGFGFYKNALDLTNRTEAARRQTYRIVGGIRGDFNTDWHYELSANYGEFDEHTKIQGNVNLQRYFLSIDAVDQGLASGGAANGNVVCRASVDPAAATAANQSAIAAGVDPTFAANALANDVSSCVPVNLFGAGNVTNAARNYLLQNSIADGKITQLDISGYVSGDTSQFLNLPGGPIGFSIGGEYRRETSFYKQDAATAAAATFYNAIPEFNPTAFVVKEAYGELRVPLLKDLPFIKSLTLNGAARVADYKGTTGTVYAYNGGFEYSPFRSLTVRANYSRSVRAPNLSDLYTPLGQNYFGFSDPCARQNRNASGASQYRAKNCALAGVPDDYAFVYQSTPGYLSGGNPDLDAEKSDSWTVGGVFTPAFLPGFSFTADYYHIKVSNVITTPDPQGIINACYDLPTLDNQFCSLFQRDTTRPITEGEYVNNSLQDTPLNFAKLINSGIDFEVDYNHQIGNIGQLSFQGLYTLALQKSQYLDPTNPNFEDRFLSELADPQNEFTLDVALKRGKVTLGYKFHYIGHQVNGAYEDFYSVQGRDPTDPYALPDKYKLYPIITYSDIRAQIDVTDKANFYLGMDNVFNQLPPFGLTGIGEGSAIYDNVGRYMYAGFQIKY
ncbi:TonB-dependent receptor [Sphingomonas koreensis]|nr:TonB-dependent receptor [Sphingomonas koreensis]